jgi:hypothetical protein
MNWKKISKGSIIVVFLALIRSIGECFRLEYIHDNPVTIEMVQPFIVSAMVCAVSCLLLVVLFFFSRYKWIVAMAVITIATLFFLKYWYHL